MTMNEPRAEWNSWFRINDLGEVRLGTKEDKLKFVGTVADVDPSLLLTGEKWIMERWRWMDAALRERGIRKKMYLVSERDQDFEYGFLWVSFGFYKKARAKRWGRGATAEDLEKSVKAFIAGLETTQPQAERMIDYDPRKRGWVFDLEIADEREARQFLEILVGHLEEFPILAFTLGAA